MSSSWRIRGGAIATPERSRTLYTPLWATSKRLTCTALGVPVGLDEPYQHYQFAGRADVVAWDVSRRALLHIENRTRFPEFQHMAGAYNAKRAYLAQALAGRVGVPSWKSETHVLVGLWSAEVLRVLRLRTDSFPALCPDPPAPFHAWWNGQPPTGGRASTLVVLDPLTSGRQRSVLELDRALSARARYRGYAEAAAALTAAAANTAAALSK
ncbi:MAG: hypothetical protein M3N29_01535 [Chloroflexota bacterium]|nr:hypothetical protein [Chloroflexota bacterium]